MREHEESGACWPLIATWAMQTGDRLTGMFKAARRAQRAWPATGSKTKAWPAGRRPPQRPAAEGFLRRHQNAGRVRSAGASLVAGRQAAELAVVVLLVAVLGFVLRERLQSMAPRRRTRAGRNVPRRLTAPSAPAPSAALPEVALVAPAKVPPSTERQPSPVMLQGNASVVTGTTATQAGEDRPTSSGWTTACGSWPRNTWGRQSLRRDRTGDARQAHRRRQLCLA